MQCDFEASNQFLLNEEKGYSADPQDPGNWYEGKLIGSNMGVTPAVLASFSPSTPITPAYMMVLPKKVQALIASKLYWQPVDGDRLPSGLDLMAFDFGYNAGVGTSCGCLRLSVGLPKAATLGSDFFVRVARPNVNYILSLIDCRDSIRFLQGIVGVTQDGLVGPHTQDAVRTSYYGRQVMLLLSVRRQQVKRYQSIGSPAYLQGWLNRTYQRFDAALKLIPTKEPGV